MVKGLCGSSTDSHPIIFRWLSLKGDSLNLVKLFDQVGHLHWHSPREFGLSFVCDSLLSPFLTSTGNTFDLHRGDKGSLAYLACISPSWLSVPSSSGPRYTHYSAHRVLRQFSFDQDIPPSVQRHSTISSLFGPLFETPSFLLLVTEESSVRSAQLPKRSFCFQGL